MIKRLVTVVAVVLLAVVAAYLVLRPGADTRTVTAHFSRAVSVFEDTEVRILGVPVGRVTAVVPEGNTVRVEMGATTDATTVADVAGPARRSESRRIEPWIDEAEVEPAPPHVLGAGIAGVADLGVPTTLLLLRHGRTPLTAAKRFSGSGGADPSLDDEGRRQADAVAALLASRADLAAVIASPLRRTRETAQAMVQRGPKAMLREFAGIGHAPTLVDPEQVAAVREFLLSP